MASRGLVTERPVETRPEQPTRRRPSADDIAWVGRRAG
jgi:hypothetical protein